MKVCIQTIEVGIKEVMNKLSIMYSLAMLWILLMDSIHIIIPELGIYWSDRISILIFVSAFIIWEIGSPARKCCCNGKWTEILFHCVPIEILLMIIFAQWHLVLSIILLLVFLAIEAALAVFLRKDEKRYPYTEKRHKWYKDIFRRCSVIVVSAVWAVPCLITIFVYELHSPVYRAEEEILKQIFAAAEQAEVNEYAEEDVYLEHINLMRCFDSATWDKFNVQEKITVLQELVDFEAQRLGIPSIRVTADLLGIITLGKYSPETKEMWINIQYLSEFSARESIQTICHEIFHSYQQYLIDNLDWENDVMQSAYFEEMREWKNNQENYINGWAESFNAYENQSLEVSARSYAEEEAERILSYIDESI